MYFWNYGLQKTCLKSPLSDVPRTSNMVNGRRIGWNLHDSAFIVFIDQSAENWVLKSLS